MRNFALPVSGPLTLWKAFSIGLRRASMLKQIHTETLTYDVYIFVNILLRCDQNKSSQNWKQIYSGDKSRIHFFI